MSIRVEPDDLADHADHRPFAYIVTVGPHDSSSRLHVMAVRVAVQGATVTCDRVGNSTRRNIDTEPSVTVVWPPLPNGGPGPHDHYTLIADGRGTVHGESVRVEVDAAILHRPA